MLHAVLCGLLLGALVLLMQLTADSYSDGLLFRGWLFCCRWARILVECRPYSHCVALVLILTNAAAIFTGIGGSQAAACSYV